MTEPAPEPPVTTSAISLMAISEMAKDPVLGARINAALIVEAQQRRAEPQPEFLQDVEAWRARRSFAREVMLDANRFMSPLQWFVAAFLAEVPEPTDDEVRGAVAEAWNLVQGQ